MKYVYRDKIELTPDLTIGDVDRIADEVTAIGEATMNFPKNISIEIEADDLWDLRELLEELDTGISHLVTFTPDKTKISEKYKINE